MDAQSDITPVAVLKPAMYRKRIRGRITKLWTAHSATDGKKFSHDFIFVDKEVHYFSKILTFANVLTTNNFVVILIYFNKENLPPYIYLHSNVLF